MRKESELFQWVESLANEGTWQSEGRFTLDQDKAWEKLSSYQLPFPEAWILKLVQAAVLSACNELRVRQTGSETTFRFVGKEQWTETAVTQAMFSSGDCADQGLLALAAAVRYLAGRARKLLALHYPGGQTQVWDGQALRVEDSPYPVEQFELTIFAAEKRGLRWLLQAGVGADESARVGHVLSSLAYPSPIPILVDGRRINGFSSDPHAGSSSATAPIALIPLKPSVLLPEFRFIRDKDWKPEKDEISLTVEGELEALQGDVLRCGALVCLTACVTDRSEQQGFAPQPSYLKWIRDGVVVSAEQIPAIGTVGATILLSAEGLRTDLSGLTISQDQSYNRRRKDAMQRVRVKLLELARENVEKALRIGLRGRVQKAAIVTFTSLAFFQPVFLGMAGIAAAQYASERLRVKRREFQLRADFRMLCENF
ncbi:MAG: hypothetical protein WC423_18840 [Vulcanimicrobiota bacterium]